MIVHTSQDAAESRRMYLQTTTEGEVYTNDAGVEQYFNNMAVSGFATAADVNIGMDLYTATSIEQELIAELWTQPTVLAPITNHNIRLVNTPETLATVSRFELDYIFSDPRLMAMYEKREDIQWDNYTPTADTTLWETVNTGTTVLHDKSITTTEFINDYRKLTVDQRVCILESQEYIREQMEDVDPWRTHITYY